MQEQKQKNYVSSEKKQVQFYKVKNNVGILCLNYCKNA